MLISSAGICRYQVQEKPGHSTPDIPFFSKNVLTVNIQ